MRWKEEKKVDFLVCFLGLETAWLLQKSGGRECFLFCQEKHPKRGAL